MLEMQHVTKAYRTDLLETHALREFGLKVEQGRVRRGHRAFRLRQDDVPERRGPARDVRLAAATGSTAKT